MRLFHGTTLENAIKIANEGFTTSGHNWTVSEPATVYAWGTYEGLKELLEDELDEEELADRTTEAVRYALDSANAAAVISGYKGTDFAILEFDLDIDFLNEDFSNERGRLPNAFTIGRVLASNNIKAITVYHDAYAPELRFFHIYSNIIEYGHLSDRDFKIASLVCDLDRCSLQEELTYTLYEASNTKYSIEEFKAKYQEDYNKLQLQWPENFVKDVVGAWGEEFEQIEKRLTKDEQYEEALKWVQ